MPKNEFDYWAFVNHYKDDLINSLQQLRNTTLQLMEVAEPGTILTFKSAEDEIDLLECFNYWHSGYDVDILHYKMEVLVEEVATPDQDLEWTIIIHILKAEN